MIHSDNGISGIENPGPPDVGGFRFLRSQLRARMLIAVAVVVLASIAYFAHPLVGLRGAAALGILSFLGVAAFFSADLAAVNWRTIGWGIALQTVFALLVIKLEIGGVRPGEAALRWCARAIEQFLKFAEVGARFVFGPLADPAALKETFHRD